MTGDPAAEHQPRTEDDDLPPVAALPRWIPVAIALVLVAIGAIAVYTGWHWRAPVGERQPLLPGRAGAGGEVGAPGEPEAGASRVLHGDAGDTVPAPNAPAPNDRAKVVITGDARGMTEQVRLSVRRGLITQVVPPDAIVYVNDQAIGEANQFATAETVYEFANPGSYNIRLAAPGHKDVEYVITADPEANVEVAVIRATMDPQ